MIIFARFLKYTAEYLCVRLLGSYGRRTRSSSRQQAAPCRPRTCEDSRGTHAVIFTRKEVHGFQVLMGVSGSNTQPSVVWPNVTEHWRKRTCILPRPAQSWDYVGVMTLGARYPTNLYIISIYIFHYIYFSHVALSSCRPL